MSPPRAGSHRQPTLGTDPWREIGGRVWSQWDLWLSLICAVDHGGDWHHLEAVFLERGQPRNRDAEAKLSHLDDLVARLAGAGLSVGDLVRPAFDDKTLRLKARTKVLRQELMQRDLSEPMVNTPRARHQERALRGYWASFSVSPERFWREVDARPFYGERATMGLAHRLERLQGRLLAASRRDTAARLAIHRALLTAGYEAHARADDSCGMLGQLLKESWEAYAGIDWRKASVDAETYYRDVCEMVVWDDFATLCRIEEVPFRAVRAEDVEQVDAILEALAAELSSARLEFQAGEARGARAWLHLAQGELSGFVKVASDLGSERWIPIDRMAQAALERGRLDLAEAVFVAADQPGFHRNYLQERRQALLGPGPHRPRLAVLD